MGITETELTVINELLFLLVVRAIDVQEAIEC